MTKLTLLGAWLTLIGLALICGMVSHYGLEDSRSPLSTFVKMVWLMASILMSTGGMIMFTTNKFPS